MVAADCQARATEHLKQYRKDNLDHVRRLEFSPSGVSSETAAIATALGSCLVDAPDLQEQLVTLLKAQHQQHLSQRVRYLPKA